MVARGGGGQSEAQVRQHAEVAAQWMEDQRALKEQLAQMRQQAEAVEAQRGRDARDDRWDVTPLRARARVAQQALAASSERLAELAKELRDLDGQVGCETVSCGLVEESPLGFVGEA